MMQSIGRGGVFVGSAALLLILSAPVVAEDTGTIEEIVSILRNEGLIDEATQQKLLVKHASEQQKRRTTGGVLGGLDWSGDLRLRHEAFWFDGDATGTPEPDNRYRFRYRARIGFQKQLGDRIRVGMRLASGVGSNRGQNVSFGEQPDWRPDDIFIDRAWVELRLGDGPVDTRLMLGRVPNPFRWSIGLDRLMWDPDVSPEGGYLRARKDLGERSELWATLGAFIAEENSGVLGSKSDPKVFVLQLGASHGFTDSLEVGGRVSGYEWRSLDSRFVDRAKLFGNLDSAFDGKARIGELSVYTRFTAADAWPVLLHGTSRRTRRLSEGSRRTRRTSPGERGSRLAMPRRTQSSASRSFAWRRTRSSPASRTATCSTARRTARASLRTPRASSAPT
jgi:hypothetical protein